MTRKFHVFPPSSALHIGIHDDPKETTDRFEGIIQDDSYTSAYSPVYTQNMIGSPDSGRKLNEKKGRQKAELVSPDLIRSDVASVHYLSTANPSRSMKSGEKNLNEGRNQTVEACRSSSSSSYLMNSETIDSEDSCYRFGQFKRFQSIKRAERPAPYYVDPNDGPEKATSSSATKSRVGYSCKPKVLQESIVTLDSRSPRNCSSSHSFPYMSPYRSEERDEGCRSQKTSLYSALQELADDDSYQAHYDQVKPTTSYSPKKSSTPEGIERCIDQDLEDGRSGGILRDTSRNDRCQSHSQLNLSWSPTPTNSQYTNRTSSSKSDKEVIDSIEGDICQHLGSRIGPLRQSLKQKDLSHSGVVNFEEFHASMQSLGVRTPKPDLRTVFDAVSEDRRGKGTVSSYEAWGNDIRYSHGNALDIEKFVERVLEGKTDAGVSDGSYSTDKLDTEQRRVMKKVLHATNKQAEPLRVFSHITHGTGCSEGKGETLSHLAPAQLKDGLKTLGSNLTDKEFECLLHKVGKSHDGKISLSDFDEILHSKVSGYDSDSNIKRRNSLISHKRYSKTFQSCDALNNHYQDEYDKVTQSDVGRADSMKWGKLQGVVQENCHNLTKAFCNAERYLEGRGRSTECGTRFQKRSRSLGVGRSEGIHPKGHDFESTGITTSGRYYERGRQEREERNAALDTEPFQLPISKLRDVLSDAGIQLGCDDAERLRSVVARDVSNSPRNPKGTGIVQETGGDVAVTLERFCGIMGIKMEVAANPYSSHKELVDPRFTPVDGGIFSRSIVAPSYSPRPPPECFSDFMQPRAVQQLQLLRSHMADNRLKNFSSTYLSDDNPKSATPTSLDGSRRRYFEKNTHVHTNGPSKFWELEHAGRTKDIMPSPFPSFRELYSSKSVSDMGCGSGQSVSFSGSAGIRERNRSKQQSYTESRQSRFDTISPVKGNQQPLSLSEWENRERGGGGGGGDRGRGGSSMGYAYQTPNRKRSSSAPPRSTGASMSSDGDFSRQMAGGGLNLRWASQPLAEFIGSKIQASSSAVECASPRTVSRDRTVQSTPGSSSPSTLATVSFHSPERVAQVSPPRSFSLRKSFPDRLGYGSGGGSGSVSGSASVASGSTYVRSVSSTAPYAVTLPDQ